MALTQFQRDVCRLLAQRRRGERDSYVAGGVALTDALGASRLSRDVDVFHDTTDAVARSWDADRAVLTAEGYGVEPTRERPGFVSASVRRGTDEVAMEWAADSAFRFYPLVEHVLFGLALHPFDLATNKVLALVGRLEARDWVDVVECSERLQPLGYLAWAACGKDPGFTPHGILEQSARSARYSDDEIAALAFDGPHPTAADVSRRWHAALDHARLIVALLPARSAGAAVVTRDGTPFRGDAAALPDALRTERVLFHQGRIGGAWPRTR